MVHIDLKTLKNWEKDGFLIMVSGGVDSMVLLDLCKFHQPHIVHFDHQARHDSHKDHDMLLNYASNHQLIYHQIILDVPKKNFQHEAHMLRQSHAIKYAKTHQLKHVLTAHHGDDLIETMLIKMIRGTHLEGYIGMKAEHMIDGVHFHKPLLDYTKDDIFMYAKTHNIVFLNDHTNDDDTYLRNRLRHHVIPTLKQENTSLHAAFSKLSNALCDAHDIVKRDAELFLKHIPWSIPSFLKLEHSVQKEVLSMQLKAFHISPTYPLIKQLKKLLIGRSPNARYPLNATFQFMRTYDAWSIEPYILHDQTTKTLQEAVPVHVNNMIFTYFHNPTSLPSKTVKICYNQLAFPLVLRRRLEGDVLTFAFGHKKLKSYLIDKKVPKTTRDQLWVLSDQHHTILWIPHLYLNTQLGNEHTLHLHIEEVSHAS
jgi:bifunctional protein TilS/HprT